MTKLLLLEDVSDLGRKGDLVNVKPGYARNYLLPRSLGVVATKNTIRMQEKLQEERQQQAEKESQQAQEVAEKLKGVVITTSVKVDSEGHMYGSVSIQDIISLIQDQLQVSVEKQAVQLKHAIKKTGDHTIHLRLSEDVESSLLLKIVPEGIKEEE